MSRAATDRLKVNPPLGSPPTLEWRAVGELQIDATYQRSIQTGSSQTLIRRIAQFWDWGLCQPLAIARRADGSLMVVDGQHRLEAARLRRDIPHLPCVITAYANAGDEAAAFVALNQQRRPLTKLDLFKAALAAEDTDSLAIVAAMDRAGLRLAAHSNFTAWKPGDVSNIAGIQRYWQRHGATVVQPALIALAKGFEGEVLRYCGTIFDGIAGFLSTTDIFDEELDRLISALKRRNQAGWRAAIIAAASVKGIDQRQAARHVITEAFFHEAKAKATIPDGFAEPTDLRPAEMAWCSQCDRRVSGAHAGRCTDRFCKLKVKVAA